MAITDKAMQAKPGASDQWLTQAFTRGGGVFVGRISPSGERLFYFRYTDSKGGRPFLPIGPYHPKGDGAAAFTVAQANSKATDWSALYRTGVKDLREHFAQLEADRLQSQALERQRISDEQRQRSAEEQEAALAQQRRLTLRRLFDEWRAADLKPRIRADGKRTGRVDGGLYVLEQFTRHVFPRIGDTALEDLRKADLLAVLDTQKSAGKMRTANVLLADLKQMLDFALERELVASNPLAAVKKNKVGGPSVQRVRTLGDDEIKLLRGAIAKANMNPRNAIAIWLALATGVRIGELMGAVWSDLLPLDPKARKSSLDALQALCDAKAIAAAKERYAKAVTSRDQSQIDAEADRLATFEELGDPYKVKVGVIDRESGTWYLPDTKNQRDHTIHLSKFARDQLGALAELREAPNGEMAEGLHSWVFPATDTRYPVCVKSFGKQLLDRQRNPDARLSNRTKATKSLVLPGGHWTAHDLRRTAATVMARLGFPSDTIHECLNHVQADRMARVYIQDRREADQRKAFDALGDRLAVLARGVQVSGAEVDGVRAA